MTDPDLDLRELHDIADPFAEELSAPLPAAPLPPPPPALTRHQVRRRHLAALLLALVYEAMMLMAMGLRPDLSLVPRGVLLAALGLPLLAAAASLYLALRTGPLRIGQAAPEVGVSLLVPSALFVLSSFAPAGSATPEGLWRATAMCVMGTTMLLVGPLGLALLAFRRAFVTAAAPALRRSAWPAVPSPRAPSSCSAPWRALPMCSSAMGRRWWWGRAWASCSLA